jgi:hypothetical protein
MPSYFLRVMIFSRGKGSNATKAAPRRAGEVSVMKAPVQFRD